MSEIEKLGQTLNKRIHAVFDAKEGLKPEIGSITDNLGLQVQAVKNTIPKEDYLVEAQTSLKPGDRVLTVWCGMEPIIVAVLREGAEAPIDPNAPSDLIDVLQKVFPVGTLRMTSASTNPATLFGGTWEDSGDAFLMEELTRELYTWEKKKSDDSVTIKVSKGDLDAVLAKTYPVGTIHISASETNPCVFFGGTWEKSGDCFVLTADGEATRNLYTWEKTADTVTAETTESISEIVLQLWTVGSVYISASENNPAEHLGGTWVESGDIFVLSADGTATRALHTWERTA